MDGDKKLLEPENRVELLRGWLLHAHKGRDRHDTAARRFEGRRILFGVPAIVLTAVVGTSVFASIGSDPAVWTRVCVGILSMGAAVLSALQTFLDYQVRSERHRVAAVKYKAIIRELEEVLSAPRQDLAVEPAWLADLQKRLDTLEEEMPVVAPGIYDDVERTYANPVFVKTALALYR
jgi:hypothetical protein